MIDSPNAARLIWATRGRSWGFRFLLDGGLSDPLPDYEKAFGDLTEEPSAWRREGDLVAVRFPDPLGRRDAAGRVIPHEFVILGAAADAIGSVEDGVSVVWPLVADAYERIWDAGSPPPDVDVANPLADGSTFRRRDPL